MGYDIQFRVKVEGLESTYLAVGDCNANITWNLREMIVKSTGLDWKNEENNGLCKNVIPYIQKGYDELVKYPEKYKKYESQNGWGTISGCINFFSTILKDWEAFCENYETNYLVDAVYFWIC